MRFNKLSNMKQVSFKLRNYKKTRYNRFIFGNSMVVLQKNCRFEAIYFELFRKFIKNIVKKKNIPTTKNYWIFLRMNTPLTKKSKNSRMGKGKGALYRWCIRLPKYYKLIEFKNINKYRMQYLTKVWSKKINLPLAFLSKANF